MLKHAQRRQGGFTLIELMLALGIMAILLFVGVPSLTTTIQNYQIRTASEATLNGLQYARNEALRRNTSVRFQLVSSLDADCNLAATGANWVVSRNDPSAACASATVIDFLEPNDLSQPQILATRAGQDGSPNVAVSATSGGGGATTVIFSNLGRVASGGIDTINLSNPNGGTCQSAGGKMKCMRILVGRGGQVKMCDPAVSSATDPRYCP